MIYRFAIGHPVVYQGTEHEELRGQRGIILEVLSPRLLLAVFDLPDGRKPEVHVPPEDVGMSERDALRYLHSETWTSHRREP